MMNFIRSLRCFLFGHKWKIAHESLYKGGAIRHGVHPWRNPDFAAWKCIFCKRLELRQWLLMPPIHANCKRVFCRPERLTSNEADERQTALRQPISFGCTSSHCPRSNYEHEYDPEKCEVNQ